MAETLRKGREIALQLIKDSPAGGENGLARDTLTQEEAQAEDERQTVQPCGQLACRLSVPGLLNHKHMLGA